MNGTHKLKMENIPLIKIVSIHILFWQKGLIQFIKMFEFFIFYLKI